MKLLRFEKDGQAKPAALDNQGNIRDLSDVVDDFTGQNISLEVLSRIKDIELGSLPLVSGKSKICACLADVPNFYCIGLNYASHAVETGLRIPREPIIFSKASSALSGPNDDVILPKDAIEGDWEIELGVVIGQDCYQVVEAEALNYVAGYCVINDLSERQFQTKRSGQWIKGKSLPGFGPIGPYLVTNDEIKDPQNLNLSLKLNGQIVQSSNTSDMIFPIRKIISYMSQFMRLRCGDIIATGTPSGVGMSMDPPRFLQDGDHLEGTIENLGTQTQTIKSAR